MGSFRIVEDSTCVARVEVKGFTKQKGNELGGRGSADEGHRSSSIHRSRRTRTWDFYHGFSTNHVTWRQRNSYSQRVCAQYRLTCSPTFMTFTLRKWIIMRPELSPHKRVARTAGFAVRGFSFAQPSSGSRGSPNRIRSGGLLRKGRGPQRRWSPLPCSPRFQTATRAN